MKLNANDYLSQYKLNTTLNSTLSINIDSDVDTYHNRIDYIDQILCPYGDTINMCVRRPHEPTRCV